MLYIWDGGVSVGAHEKGKIIDVVNALNGDGAFAPTRAGKIPATSLVELCFSGKYNKKEMMDLITKNGGLTSHLGTSDAREVEALIEKGDAYAKIVYDAMIYQIAKDIGAYSIPLKGNIDGIIITGGMAHSDYIVNELKRYISFLGKVIVIPGEEEMQALSNGALRVLTGEEKAREYTAEPVWKPHF